MLTLFFTMIFISELIIASWIIGKINTLRKVVNSMNAEVLEYQPKIKTSIENIHTEVSKVMNIIGCIDGAVSNTKTQCEEFCKSKFFVSVAKFLLKIPYKKIMSVLEVILTVKKFITKFG